MEQLSFFDERRVLSISDILQDVKKELENRYRDLWVQGEISNLGRPASGHLYFTLKDEKAQLSAVCFRLQARYLKFDPKDGLDVLARGTVTLYPPRGQMQMVVEFMEPLGRGALQLAFEQLKAKLEGEGLFDADRKMALPLFPTKVGVVTSPSGAAIQDILRVLKRRNDRVSILLFPCTVQGKGAAASIARGIRVLGGRNDIDVIIVGRGGGSLEDLWAFNEEEVARAIAESSVPIVSAVGHEVDFTISDFVADLRAPTPSAAAEIVSGKWSELSTQLEQLLGRARQTMRYRIQTFRRRFERLVESRGFIDAQSRIRLYSQRLDELDLRLRRVPAQAMESGKTAWRQADRELKQQVVLLLKGKRQLWSRRADQLKAFSPQAVLERGFSIVLDRQGRAVREPSQLESGELFRIRVARGKFQARKEEEDGI